MFQTTNQLQYETGWFGGSPILGHTHIPGTILFWGCHRPLSWFQGNIYIAPPKNGNVKSNSNTAKLLRSVFGGWYVLLGSFLKFEESQSVGIILPNRLEMLFSHSRNQQPNVVFFTPVEKSLVHSNFAVLRTQPAKFQGGLKGVGGFPPSSVELLLRPGSCQIGDDHDITYDPLVMSK